MAIPSVNPAFTSADDPLSGESRMGAHLIALAQKAHLEVDIQPVLPGRSNIIVRLTPSGRIRRRILLAPHLDTVTLHSSAQLTPTLRGGRLYGRGSCDTKGSVAAMFHALCAVASQARRPASTEIVFVGLIDEESGQSGSRALVKSRFKADLAIVGEPTRLKIITAHKGDIWLALQTHGKAAHGSTPELGVNAITQMATVIDVIAGDYTRRLSRKRHPLLGTATVNIGTIQGGRQPNIVPNHCEIRIDRRTLPGETHASVVKELKAILRARGCKVTLKDWKGVPSSPLETDTRLPLVQELLTLAGQDRPMGVNYFSDAGVLTTGGIPSVVFGPGDIAQAHTIDEWVSVKELDAATSLLTRFLGGQP